MSNNIQAYGHAHQVNLLWLERLHAQAPWSPLSTQMLALQHHEASPKTKEGIKLE